MTEKIDKYGYVRDLDLTKELIKDLYVNEKYDKRYQKWFEQVDNELIENDGDYTLYDKDKQYTWLGGPEGMSGIYFVTLEGWIRENDVDNIIDVNFYLKEHMIIHKIDDKWIVFVACEGD